MTRVIAAVAGADEEGPVLRVGAIFAAIYDAEFEAVHLREEEMSPLPDLDLTSDVAVPVRSLEGDVSSAIIAAIAADDVVAAVIGARTSSSGQRPAGHVALDVATHIDKPLLVVPPEAVPPPAGRALRLLVPLDGTSESALTVRALVHRLAGAEVEIVALHVFDAATAPRFLDHPEHDLPVWAREFASRYCTEPGTHVRWRAGSAAEEIADAANAEDVDAVILGWDRVLSPGRAAAVKRVLATSHVPVVLVPKEAAERTLAEAAANELAPSTSGAHRPTSRRCET